MRVKGFTIEQMIEGRKLKVLKRFKKEKADVSDKKKRKDRGFYCPCK